MKPALKSATTKYENSYMPFTFATMKDIGSPFTFSLASLWTVNFVFLFSNNVICSSLAVLKNSSLSDIFLTLTFSSSSIPSFGNSASLTFSDFSIFGSLSASLFLLDGCFVWQPSILIGTFDFKHVIFVPCLGEVFWEFLVETGVLSFFWPWRGFKIGFSFDAFNVLVMFFITADSPLLFNSDRKCFLVSCRCTSFFGDVLTHLCFEELVSPFKYCKKKTKFV